MGVELAAMTANVASTLVNGMPTVSLSPRAE
jgi:hypothetical protein